MDSERAVSVPQQQKAHHVLWFVQGAWWAVTGDDVTVGVDWCWCQELPRPCQN
jgi:hypothetical protein